MGFNKEGYYPILMNYLNSGCHCGPYFCGVLSYTDDLVLLSPSPCALCHQLASCEAFADSLIILFNSSKSQLIHALAN